MRGMIHDAFGGFAQFMDSAVNERGEIDPNLQENTTHPSENQSHPEVDKFERLMNEVKELEATSNIIQDVKVLTKGLSNIAKRFNAFDINNGYHFRTTQSSGVKVDDSGFTLVNFSRLIDFGDQERHEPFIFAEQDQQVIFVQDPKDHEWFAPRLIKPRDVFDMGEENNMQLKSSMQSDATDLVTLENARALEYEYNDCVRSGVDGIVNDIDLMDEDNNDQAQPYIEQLINNQNHSETQDHDGQSNELSSSTGGTEESSISKARKVWGPTLLKDIWKLPPGKTIDVSFNSRNQSIGKEGRKLSSFLGIIARTP
ncbi:hypothetical protein HAX54_033806 [Datura stramonium]|uniref:DUF4216 domain-containing protein n=1 Tax=Datura stramonium TaxID=4076 RepID=A0ABS8SDM3_DATST|nr:hypothetical protein [Datura stramonium]